jgi:head-tail adaptor
MRIFDGKVYRDMTAEEIAEMNAGAEQVEREYWLNISYEEAVSTEFRKNYSKDRVEAIVNNYLLDPTNALFIQEMTDM